MKFEKKPKGKNKDQNKNNPQNTKRNRFFLKFFLIVFFSLLFALSGGLLGILFAWIQNAPNIDTLQIQPENFTSTIVVEKNGKENLLKELHGEENRIYADLKEIPDGLENAFIAIEDERFRQHNGIDIKGILRAIYIDLKTMSKKEGASTLTQQIIKLNALNSSKHFKRKVQEMYLAVQVEKKWSKDQILEAYLNTINLGNNIRGVKQAAKYYFDKDISQLTLAESAVIAGITQNPSYYSPFRENNTPNKEKQKVILKKMLNLQFISEKQYNDAVKDPVYERLSEKKELLKQLDTTNSYFVDQILEDVSRALQEKLGYSSTLANNAIYRGGIKIYATLDPEIQGKLDQVLQDPSILPPLWKKDGRQGIQHTEYAVLYEIKESTKLEDGSVKDKYLRQTKYIKNPKDAENTFQETIANKKAQAPPNVTIAGQLLSVTPQPQVAVTIVDPTTGYVKALSGGIGEKQGSRTFNRATSINRQIGSTMKPLADYAPALELLGYTAATVFDDEPYGKFNNYDHTFKGLTTMREAIQDSRNIPAVKAMEAVGIKQSIKFLHKLDMSQLDDKLGDGHDGNLSTALGGSYHGVSTLQLAAAYGTFMNNGILKKPTTIYKIVDRKGNVLLEINPEPVQVFSSENAYIMTDIMRDVITKGTGTAAKFRSIKMDQAGKTGTTSDYRDRLFAGYTPYYSTAVWMGMDDNTPMKKLIQNYPAIIWRAVMEAVHKDLPYKTFNYPKDIVTSEICKDSGLLPSEGCKADPRGNRIYTEIFSKGTVPTKECDIHNFIKIDKRNGLLAHDYTPEEFIEKKSYIVLKNRKSKDITLDSKYVLPNDMQYSPLDQPNTETTTLTETELQLGEVGPD